MNDNFIVTGIKRIILVGKEEYPERMTEFTGETRHNELILHMSGKVTVRFNGKTMECDAGVIRFLPKGETKEYKVFREEPDDCIDIFFDTNVPVSDEAFTVKMKNAARITNTFKKIFSVWVSKSDGYYYKCVSLLYDILSQLQTQNYIPDSQYNAIKPAINYIDENFLSERISVSFLADKCGISRSYLKKLFIKKYGVPPVKYIIQIRINYACDLLHSELYTVTQVAEICGYNNVYFFSRQFKEYTGVTPTTFAKKYKSSK